MVDLKRNSHKYQISSDILTVDADPLIVEIQSVQDATQTTTLGFY